MKPVAVAVVADKHGHARVVTLAVRRPTLCFHGRPMASATEFLGDAYCRLCEWEAPKVAASPTQPFIVEPSR
jgi:hypothetical protein